MPDLFVPAIDLGMSLEDALAFDPPLLGEDATRSRAISESTLPYLSEDELRMFTGTPRGDVWDIRRIELNEIPAHQRVAFVENKLQSLGLTPKVLPPEEFLRWQSRYYVGSDFDARVRTAISQIVDEDEIAASLLETFQERYGLDDARAVSQSIDRTFLDSPSSSWRGVLWRMVGRAGADLQSEITAAVRRLIAKQFSEESEDS
jgi:hypothetical protein